MKKIGLGQEDFSKLLFEKQPYNQHGEPDKTSGFDHVLDAATYYLAYQYPILEIRTTSTTISMR